MSSQIITNTTISGLSYDEIDQLQTLSDYTYQESKYRLDQTGNILKQLFGKNYIYTIISMITTLILLVVLIALLI